MKRVMFKYWVRKAYIGAFISKLTDGYYPDRGIGKNAFRFKKGLKRLEIEVHGNFVYVKRYKVRGKVSYGQLGFWYK